MYTQNKPGDIERIRTWMKQGMASEPNVVHANVSAAYPNYLTFGPGVYVSRHYELQLKRLIDPSSPLPAKLLASIK